MARISYTILRPSDTTAYAPNDAFADAAAIVGGFKLPDVARDVGGAGLITDLIVVSSNDPATLLQGEIWLFNQSITSVADNAAFALSDADAFKLEGVIPFSLATTVAGSGTNSYAHLTGLNIGYHCVGSRDLYFLVKVKNAYTPASGEQFKVSFKFIPLS